MNPLRPPIYDASPRDKLRDLRNSVEAGLRLIDGGHTRPFSDRYEDIREDEFAIGNWIVRPRFPAKPCSR